jgi:hypothetical protein
LFSNCLCPLTAHPREVIHGARAVLLRVKYVVVAIANKLARIAWAVLSSGKDYRHQPLQPVAA